MGLLARVDGTVWRTHLGRVGAGMTAAPHRERAGSGGGLVLTWATPLAGIRNLEIHSASYLQHIPLK